MGNVWPSNTIKHCLVAKHVDVVLSGQSVSDMFNRCPNKQNVCFLFLCLPALKLL